MALSSGVSRGVAGAVSNERKNMAVALSGSSWPWGPCPELKSFSVIRRMILFKSQQCSLRDYTPWILA